MMNWLRGSGVSWLASIQEKLLQSIVCRSTLIGFDGRKEIERRECVQVEIEIDRGDDWMGEYERT